MFRIIALIVVSVQLGGCAVAGRWEQQVNYRDSLAAYQQCLAISGAQGCDAQRLAMEASQRAYTDMSGRSFNTVTMVR